MDLVLTFFSCVFLVLLVVAPFYIRYQKPKWKGKYSEALVNNKLLGLSDEYIVFKDLWFQNNVYSVQIDHLVVSAYGVFVIETKGYKGWIMGGEYSDKWIQNLYGCKYEFYNPIRQNESHIRFLRHLLKCSVEIPVVPIVVFNNDAKIKIRIREHIVVNRKRLKSAIKQYKEVLLSDEIVERITQIVQANLVEADKRNVRFYKDNIKIHKNRNKQSISNGICPACGGTLILRKGKYGKFYGCSNYPSCKFTKRK